MPRATISRRNFLKAGTAAVAAPYLIPSSVKGANDRVNVAIIGLGNRAGQIAETCAEVPGIRIVAVCDCFYPACGAFIEKFSLGQDWASYEDFREMYDKENLDGVMIETTTHARAWVTVHAMQAGMDTYIEKPMALTIAEGREMVHAARRYDRVTQVGTQQRSMPINDWASDLVKNGAIGKIHTVLAPDYVGPERWQDQPAQPMPQGGSNRWWDVWTNQAVMRPYHMHLHDRWAWWWDYDGGGRGFGVTGWGTHSYDQIQRALGTDETCPTRILLEEPVATRETGKYEEEPSDDDTGTEYHQMVRRIVGPRAKIRMTYANGTELRLHLDGDWGPGLGAIFIGEEGKIEINRNKIAANPKELIQSPDNPGPNQKLETAYHIEDWIDCIKTRKRCTADIEYGQRTTTLCYLVNIARDVGRVGETLRWDPDAERFTNCDEGNAMLSRPRRIGYELPDLG